ncbi:hypothetical protein Aduo_016336 [Ancylostoma duodenale]
MRVRIVEDPTLISSKQVFQKFPSMREKKEKLIMARRTSCGIDAVIKVREGNSAIYAYHREAPSLVYKKYKKHHMGAHQQSKVLELSKKSAQDFLTTLISLMHPFHGKRYARSHSKPY